MLSDQQAHGVESALELFRGGGIRLWTGAENQGYSLEYDDRAAAPPGLHVRTHDQDPDGATRLFVGRNGDIGVGTTAPANAEQVSRVVDVAGASSAKLSVRGARVEAAVLAHDSGVFGSGLLRVPARIDQRRTRYRR